MNQKTLFLLFSLVCKFQKAKSKFVYKKKSTNNEPCDRIVFAMSVSIRGTTITRHYLELHLQPYNSSNSLLPYYWSNIRLNLDNCHFHNHI